MEQNTNSLYDECYTAEEDEKQLKEWEQGKKRLVLRPWPGYILSPRFEEDEVARLVALPLALVRQPGVLREGQCPLCGYVGCGQ